METMFEPCGILPIDKPAGITSHDVVNRIRRLYNTRRVGHTGTLDPMATGVLVVLVGRAAKAAEYLVSDRKVYHATLQLGLTTDTEDITGQVLSTCDTLPTPEAVAETVASFLGKSTQVPPMYSALKVGGQKLVDLARRGIEVERAAREITVYDISCTPLDAKSYRLAVACSAGTYIRTLCADIGKALGCCGVMASLRRVETGGFALDKACTLEQIEAADEAERHALLVPTEALFADLAPVHLPAFYERLCRNGCEIYLKKLGISHPIGTRLRLCDASGGFFALGEVRDYPDGPAIKAIKFFDV
ncbi:MAG: tRNA pseudouridine(55) synthase TruB [Clostridia bacterium]|nr:tRNA pseudouridine(55) synthase TruB [Clostridia bacterium]